MAATEALRAEVREIVQKKFAEGHAALRTNPEAPAHNEKSGAIVALSESIIDLITRSTNAFGKFSKEAIAGSEVSMASTSSHPGDGGNTSAFSGYSQGTDGVSTPQMFATPFALGEVVTPKRLRTP